MNARTVVTSLCAVLAIVCSVLVCVGPVVGADPPTVASIVAAMEAQQAACGPSLDIAYTHGALGVPKRGHGRDRIRYVRTHKLLFMEVKRERMDASGRWVLRETIRCSYHRITKVYKELATDSGGGALAAKTSTDSVTRFTSDPMADVLLRPLFFRPLADAVGKGTVGTEQEVVDGRKCWSVDIPTLELDSNRGSSARATVWLDPNVGFCPRRIVEEYMGKGSATVKTATEFRNYRSFRGGVWIPMDQVVYFDAARNTGTRIVVRSVSVGKKIPEGDLAVNFPSGTRVLRLPSHEYFTAP